MLRDPLDFQNLRPNEATLVQRGHHIGRLNRRHHVVVAIKMRYFKHYALPLARLTRINRR